MASSQTEQVMAALENVAERTVVKIALDVTANLIEFTPVDTGWARANWVPSIGRRNPPGDISDPRPAEVAAAKTEQAGGVASLLGYRLQLGQVRVSNNVPYIERLNDGSSEQAPAGFVQLAIKKAVTVDILGLGS